MIGTNLKYNIDIYKDEETRDALGSITSSNKYIDTIKAGLLINIGKATNKEDVIVNQTEATFYIRNYPVMTYQHYIIYNGDRYNILAIQPMLDRSGQTIKAVRNG